MRAYVYARQSFSTDDESASIEVQVKNCKNYCEKNNIEVAGVFTDPNTSSELFEDTPEGRKCAENDYFWNQWNSRQRSKNRKKFKEQLGKLLSNLEGIDIVIVNERTRYYRNPSPYCSLENHLMGILIQHGIKLVEAETGKAVATDNIVDISVQQIISNVKMAELSSRREQSLNSVKNLHEKGIFWRKQAGLKYEEGQMTITEREYISYVFEEFLNGKTIMRITKDSNAKFGLQRTRCLITKTLKNPLFAGYGIVDGVPVKAVNLASKPVITLAQWYKVQQMLEDNASSHRRQATKVHNPLSGYIVCGECGKRMGLVYHGVKGQWYRCVGHIEQNIQEHHSSRFKVISKDYSVYQTVQCLFASIYWKLHYTQEQKNPMTELKIKVDALAKKQSTMTDLFLAGTLVESVYKAKIEELNAQMTELRKELKDLEIRADDDSEKRLQEAWKRYSELDNRELLKPEVYDHLLRETLEKITVFADRMEFSLTDGNSFSLPRRRYHRRNGKTPLVLPIGEVHGQAVKYKNGVRIKQIITYKFFDQIGQGYDILLDTEDYQIRLVRN